MKAEPRWEHFEHGADVGVRGIAPTAEGAFEQAALAMTAVAIDPTKLTCDHRVRLQCEAPDRELLLAEWLNALIYESATRGMLFGRFRVRIEGNRLSASAWGEKIDLAKHEFGVEVKGATYTALSVYEDAAGAWTAQCVVDV